jgi:hypothetical protein
MAVANTLAYYNTALKSFVAQTFRSINLVIGPLTFLLSSERLSMKIVTVLYHQLLSNLKYVNTSLDTKIAFYLETLSGQNSSLYLNVVHFFKTSVN